MLYAKTIAVISNIIIKYSIEAVNWGGGGGGWSVSYADGKLLACILLQKLHKYTVCLTRRSGKSRVVNTSRSLGVQINEVQFLS